MARDFFLDLAQQRHSAPIAADLMLALEADGEAVRLDGDRLGAVIEKAARHYRTPLAVPLMDLLVEKTAIGRALGIADELIESFHVDAAPSAETIERVVREVIEKPTPRMRAVCDAIRYVAKTGDLVPIGMCIGPFSLMVRLTEEPILPVYTAASGVGRDEDPEVDRLFALLELATRVVVAYVTQQIEAGAKAVFICEPAANTTYLSPHQFAATPDARPDIFDRCVLAYNRQLFDMLEARGVDAILHDCGELNDEIVRRLSNELHPTMLSLGSSRKLWEDAKLVPDDVVLFGNLPSKQFYSDTQTPLDGVRHAMCELRCRMKEAGQPFILGTECDVLCVRESEQTIRDKVELFANGCACGCHAHA